MRSTTRNDAGFSLIELLVATVIVGILAATAIPAYNDYIIKTRRSDAHVALQQFAMAMERYYIENNGYYTGSTISDVYQLDSPEGFYEMGFGTVTNQTFIITATPVAPQDADTECSMLSLTHLGAKRTTGTQSVKHCW